MTIKKIKDPERKPKWTLFQEFVNPNVNLLFDVYKIDPKKARVLYCQRKTEHKQVRFVLFEWPNDEFRIAKIVKSFGISKTNRIYSSEKTHMSIRYTKGKFYYQNGLRIKQATWSEINSFIYDMLEDKTSGYSAIDDNVCYKFLLEKFGWIRNIREDYNSHGITLNLIKSRKLFSKKAMQRYQFKTTYPSIKIIEANLGNFEYSSFLKMWDEMRHNLINTENLTEEFIKSPYLKDTSLMADALGEKINCAWSAKRLKLEHDKWAKRVTEVILEFEPLRDLKVNNIFKLFEEFSGYELLRTNHELIAEGKRMGHCVGTYSSKVDGGTCGIFRANDCTLELVVQKPYYKSDMEFSADLGISDFLRVNQYRGFSNDSAPSIYQDVVNELVLEFNKTHMKNYRSTETIEMADILPF